MKNYFLVIALILSGCSSLPVAISEPPAQDIQLREVVANFSEFQGWPIRWGGTIIDVQNEKLFTRLQILQFPLDSYGRPKVYEASQGRFIIQHSAFLDPVLYDKGSVITAAGTVESELHQMVGNKPLKLPVISSQEIYLWSDEQSYRQNYYYTGYHYGGFGYGGYYPYGGYGYGYRGHYPYHYYGYGCY